MNKQKVLMIAFHFPPQAGSSGILRTLNFAKYLPANGWIPIVLSALPSAYEACREDLLNSIPEDTKVIRAFALDAARHLSIKGKYPSFLALPDRWSSWWFSAVRAGLKEIRNEKPALLWSTYPISSAHLIGLTLARSTGLPWIADFRDPMINGDYPFNPLQRRIWQWLEAQVMRTATYCVFTTERAAEVYRIRYPQAAKKCVVIQNGYDEDAFIGNIPKRIDVGNEQIFMLHSGIIYPKDRDPSAFFTAISKLINTGKIEKTRLKIRFRAPNHVDEIVELANNYGLANVVDIAPPVPYRESIAEILGADLLLVFQGSQFNAQIPAKIYEYLRAGRPIMGLLDKSGDTAKQLNKFRCVELIDINNPEEIALGIQKFMKNQDSASVAEGLEINQDMVRTHSRAEHTKILANLFKKIDEK